MHKDKIYPENNDVRTIQRFLWVPTTFGGVEYRWLEFAKIEQTY